MLFIVLYSVSIFVVVSISNEIMKWATCHSCGSGKVESCPVLLAPGREE